MTRRLTVWSFLDGRAGHRNQVLGLTDRLAALASLDCREISVDDGLRGLRSLLPWTLRRLSGLPRPDLLIGAGHRTHLPMLSARRRFGGKTIVLMSPSLPFHWFDLCFVPAADELRRIPSNVVLTEGALNRVLPGTRQDPGRGLMLIGGPSNHFQWDSGTVLGQIDAVTRGTPDISWTLTTSRRTPQSFADEFTRSGIRGTMVPVHQTGPEWIASQLSRCATVWVTCDSVSMVYESLSAGAAVGLLELPAVRQSRVTRGMESLATRGLVTRCSAWSPSKGAGRLPGGLREAERCASLIVERLLSSDGKELQSFRPAA